MANQRDYEKLALAVILPFLSSPTSCVYEDRVANFAYERARTVLTMNKEGAFESFRKEIKQALVSLASKGILFAKDGFYYLGTFPSKVFAIALDIGLYRDHFTTSDVQTFYAPHQFMFSPILIRKYR